VRNYAILLLLATYGLRAGEVVRLRLEDIDWRNECLHIAPCGRTLQPSPHTQGPARCTLEAYVPRLITSPSS
jgi:integrase